MYKSWLLRIWQARSAGHVEWRASLEDPRTNERIGFASLERLYAFLRDAQRGDDADVTAPQPDAAGTTRPNELD